MSNHDTHHDQNKERKVSMVSFKNSFWLVVIIVGLFIAALNFIAAESGGEKGEKEKTEMKGAPEASAEKAEKTETKAEEAKPAETPAKDTAAKSAK